VYVARVLAGEAEPGAPDAAQQALAVAIRTFALVNAGRHARDGFDLCDSTHCQVPRASTLVTRRAALATAGRILTREGRPAEVFYSASCGGYSESADQVWPGADYPYMPAAPDDVHEADPTWALMLSLREIEAALVSAGFEGELRGVTVDSRNASGRAARIQLVGLRPGLVNGDRFRAIIGATRLRSTAFSVETQGGAVRFVGRGYGHGVGMCVIGAGRRASRGESADSILGKYFPGLRLVSLDRATPRPGLAVSGGGFEAATRASRDGLTATVGRSAGITADEVLTRATRIHADLAQQLGASVAPVAVQVHDSTDAFRVATGRPWWVSAVATGTTIDLMPAAVLAQREGLDTTLRVAIAEALVSGALRGRAVWVRVGAARYFGRQPRGPVPPQMRSDRCPADAELEFAVSAAAQRDAESRAEACFARAYVAAGDWRAVR